MTRDLFASASIRCFVLFLCFAVCFSKTARYSESASRFSNYQNTKKSDITRAATPTPSPQPIFNPVTISCLNASIVDYDFLSEGMFSCLDDIDSQINHAIYVRIYSVNSKNGTEEVKTTYVFTQQDFYAKFNVKNQRINYLSLKTIDKNTCLLDAKFTSFCGLKTDSSSFDNSMATLFYTNFFVDYAPVLVSLEDTPEEIGDATPGTVPASYFCETAEYYDNGVCCKIVADPSSIWETSSWYEVTCDTVTMNLLGNFVFWSFLISIVGSIVLLNLNVDFWVPLFYRPDDTIIVKDTDAPLFFHISDEKVKGFRFFSVFGYTTLIKFFIVEMVMSLPILITIAVVFTGKVEGEVVFFSFIVVCTVYSWIFVFQVFFDRHTQDLIRKSIPRPVYVRQLLTTILQASEKKHGKSSWTYRRRFAWIIFSSIVFVVFLVVYFFSIIIIGVFTTAGIAANSDETLSQASLIVAVFMIIQSETYNMKRGMYRVKTCLLDKEQIEIEKVTWRELYQILHKLHWTPLDVLKKRLPIYVIEVSALLIIYTGLTFFVGKAAKQEESSSSSTSQIFQSVLLLVIGYMPNFTNSESTEQYYLDEAIMGQTVTKWIDALPADRKKGTEMEESDRESVDKKLKKRTNAKKKSSSSSSDNDNSNKSKSKQVEVVVAKPPPTDKTPLLQQNDL